MIYVNARHRDVHYRTIAEDIRGYVPSTDARVLDYGCGEASSAHLLAEAAGHLSLVEAAPNVRAALAARYAGNPKISVISPGRSARLPDGSFDLIVLHSVAQYLSAPELDGLLASFRRLLKPDGLFDSRRYRASRNSPLQPPRSPCCASVRRKDSSGPHLAASSAFSFRII